MGDLLAFRSASRDGQRLPGNTWSAICGRWPTSRAGTRRRSSISRPALRITTLASGDYGSLRRNAGDFYTEGELMWLDVDTIIRQISNGKKSIDDYTKVFAGGVSEPLASSHTRVPTSSVPRARWRRTIGTVLPKYVYWIAPLPADTDEITTRRLPLRHHRQAQSRIEADFGEGRTRPSTPGSTLACCLESDAKGEISDVREGSPAWNAGLGKGMETVPPSTAASSPPTLGRGDQSHHNEFLADWCCWWYQAATTRT